MSVTVGVDMGGTKIAAAVVDEHNRVLARERLPTPEGPEAVVAAIRDVVQRLAGEPLAVGVGAPGPVHEGVVQNAPNLPGFNRPVPLGKLLARGLGLPVVIENDVNAGTVGEWLAGAGRGARFLLGVFLGTGVGGGLVLEGKPYLGAFGGAGEFGHMCVRQGGAVCGCGRRGCIEPYAGRGSMERVVDMVVAAGRPTRLAQIKAEKGRDRLTSGIWAKALEEGDQLATTLIDDAVQALGAGIGAAVNLLDIERVVVGGGLTEKLGQPLVDRIAEATEPYLLVPGAPRSFVVAELADDAGVVGAAALARSVGLTTSAEPFQK